jgi:hypothetical protein
VQKYQAAPRSFWVALAKPTSWYDDNNPPYLGVSFYQLPEVIGFVFVHSCVCVYSDSNGALITPNGQFSAVTSNDPAALSSAKANKVYFEALLNASSTPTNSSYRMRGLCTDVVYDASAAPNPAAGTFISAGAVSYYFLDWVSTLEPITNDGTTDQVIQIVREF